MNKIFNLITENFNLSANEKELATEICSNINNNFDKIFGTIKNLIKCRLDYGSVIAYIAYEINYDLKNTDKDILFIFDSLKNDLNSLGGLSRQEQAEVLRKMFIALCNDVRVVIIRLCIMLNQISFYSLPLTKEEYSFVLDVREIFAPLAERLGLNFIKSDLEDYCLKLLNPKIYNELANNTILEKNTNMAQVEETKRKLEEIVKGLGLTNVQINARQKHFSSIYKKLTSKNVSLANIYDLIAVRVIVEKVEDCYAVLGKIHAIYKPMEGRFKDYIASPKLNGYQSLHTTIIAENERPLEIQIRTFDMHKMAEFGVLAHWLYKEKRTKLTDLDKKMTWLREIMESSVDMNSDEFIESLKINLCAGQIYAQTPKGKVIEFPEGATILDFAYAIHSDIGNSCVGGKINGNIKPLTTKLKSGDVVEIITSTHSKGPSKDWLKIVKTNQARNKINAFFKKELKEENIKNGIAMLELAIKNKGLSPSKLMVDKYLDLSHFKYVFATREELFAAVGYGSVPVNNIANRIIALYEHDNKKEIIKEDTNTTLFVKRNKNGVLVDGDSGMLIRYAGCCSPVYGEDIIGYISRGRGVTVHRNDCQNIKYLETERLINAIWDDNSVNKTTNTIIKIISSKSDNFLNKLIQSMSTANYRILGLDSKENSNDKIVTTIKVEVNMQEDLTKIIRLIKEINSVEDVFRLGK